jgi:putative oxidoreductase
MKDTTHVDDRSTRGGGGDGSALRLRAERSVPAASGGAGLRRRLEILDRNVRGLLVRASPLLLRMSLAIVFVWFGVLKVVGASAVGGLVASTVPFLDSAWFVPALGVVEVLIGVAFATGRLLRLVLPVFAVHMAGTFLVLVTLPAVAFQQANPLLLTAVGEFVVKNVVLLSAGLVVASGVRPLRARGAEA